MGYNEIIEQIKGMDLKTVNPDELKKLIHQFGKFGTIVHTLNSGLSVLRARPEEKYIEYGTIDDLSYKPQKFNTTYQRASTPNRTMFYGCPYPNELQGKPLTAEESKTAAPRVTAMFESIHNVRPSYGKGIWYLSFGKWVLDEDLMLFSAMADKSLFGKMPFLRDAANHFYSQSALLDPEIRDKTIALMELITTEFIKPDISTDHDYLISALFSEIASNKGLQGVLYPSCRIGLNGLNVAILPDFAKRLLFRGGGVVKVAKYNGMTVQDNIKVISADGQNNLIYADAPEEVQRGDAWICQQLGIQSLDIIMN